jgi:uncharacterized membrane protein
MVLLRLLDVIAAVVPYAHRPEDRAVLAQHIHLVGDSGEAGLCDESDRQALRQRLLAVESLLDGSRPLRAPEPAEMSGVGADR